MQHARGFIVGCANRLTLISWEAEHTEQQIGQAFYEQKNHTISILHTGYKVIGYTFAKQSYWYKLRGLHVYKAILLAQTSRLLFKLKAILLVQMARAFVQTLGARWLFSSPAGFYWVHIDWLAPGHPMGAGNPTISRETETQVPAACQPQPRQPHIIKLISQLQKPTRKIADK